MLTRTYLFLIVNQREWLKPRSSTRLIDTALERLAAQERNVQQYAARNRCALRDTMRLFTLLTDGQDNVSDCSSSTLKSVITTAREQHDTVAIFLSANQDATLVGASYGFEKGLALSFDLEKAEKAYTALDSLITAYVEGRARSFTDEERTAAIGDAEVKKGVNTRIRSNK